MNKRLLFVALLVVLLLAATAVYIATTFQRTLAFDPLPTFDTTVISGRPAGAECINKSSRAPLAIELIDLEQDVVYLAGGENPISVEQWDNTAVRFPHLKNSKRYLLFDDTCLYRAFGTPADCQGAECATFTELYDHTWFTLNGIAGFTCYPDPDGCEGDVVNPGYVSLTTIDKCQEITFSGPTINELVDEWGNRYVMHATDDGQPQVAGVPLPPGWTLSEVTLSQPLTIQPRGDGHCYYNIMRDAHLQSYHQYVFAEDVFTGLGE